METIKTYYAIKFIKTGELLEDFNYNIYKFESKSLAEEFIKKYCRDSENYEVIYVTRECFNMKKEIKFGKIDFNGSGRKNCPVDVVISLCDSDKGPVFSCVGHVWNTKKTDYYRGGQCLDTLNEYLHDNELFKKIYYFWKNYHLNDLRPGDEEQESAVGKYLESNRYDYEEVCKFLKSIGLFEHNGISYGFGWHYKEIPENDLNEIKKLITEEN